MHPLWMVIVEFSQNALSTVKKVVKVLCQLVHLHHFSSDRVASTF